MYMVDTNVTIMSFTICHIYVTGHAVNEERELRIYRGEQRQLNGQKLVSAPVYVDRRVHRPRLRHHRHSWPVTSSLFAVPSVALRLSTLNGSLLVIVSHQRCAVLLVDSLADELKSAANWNYSSLLINTKTIFFPFFAAGFCPRKKWALNWKMVASTFLWIKILYYQQ